MSNIIDRLRNLGNDLPWEVLQTGWQASDEIERLNTENARLRKALEKIANIPLWDEFECTKIARAALAETERNNGL